MASAEFVVVLAGPMVTIQDLGRPGFLRYGAPSSGPMDRGAYQVSQAALGEPEPGAVVEVSIGGLTLECVEGAVTIAVAGGGFDVSLDRLALGSWFVATIRAGSRLTIKPGPWGAWTYLGFAGRLRAPRWLGSVSTHTTSNLGGGRIFAGQRLEIDEPQIREARAGPVVCPAWARPRREVKVVLGPQDRFFARSSTEALVSQPFALTDSYDRMGVRLAGPSLRPAARLDMPSGPIVRGSIQVSGDGIATVLLADHQTAGGYPRIATIVSDQLDGFAQLRSRQTVNFSAITAAAANSAVRARSASRRLSLQRLAARPAKFT